MYPECGLSYIIPLNTLSLMLALAKLVRSLFLEAYFSHDGLLDLFPDTLVYEGRRRPLVGSGIFVSCFVHTTPWGSLSPYRLYDCEIIVPFCSSPHCFGRPLGLQACQ